MTRRNRKKPSEIFEESKLVYAEKVSFEEAFPEIKDLTVKVRQTGRGPDDRHRERVYGKGVGELIDCQNPLCYNGSFPIGNMLREMVKKKQTDLEKTDFCRGYDGSINTRCMLVFIVEVHVDYK